MARKRMIDPQIWHDEKFIRLPLNSRLLFIGLISHADDTGYITADPQSLLARIVPDHTLRTAKISAWLKPIEDSKMVIRYRADDGEEFLRLANWSWHQKIDKPRPSAIEARNLTPVDPRLRPDCPTTDGGLTADSVTTDGKLSTDCRQTGAQLSKNDQRETTTCSESSSLIEENRREENGREASAPFSIPKKWQPAYEILQSIDAPNYRNLQFDQAWIDRLEDYASRFHLNVGDITSEAERFKTWLLGQFDVKKEQREKNHNPRTRFLNTWLPKAIEYRKQAKRAPEDRQSMNAAEYFAELDNG